MGGGGHVLFGVPGESGDQDLQGRGFEVHPGGSDRETGVVREMIRSDDERHLQTHRR